MKIFEVVFEGDDDISERDLAENLQEIYIKAEITVTEIDAD